MEAKVGDMVVVHGHRAGDPDRRAQVLQVQGHDGQPPYLVRWGDDGHVGLFFPGSDATVEHHRQHRARGRTAPGLPSTAGHRAAPATGGRSRVVPSRAAVPARRRRRTP